MRMLVTLQPGEYVHIKGAKPVDEFAIIGAGGTFDRHRQSWTIRVAKDADLFHLAAVLLGAAVRGAKVMNIDNEVITGD